MIGRKLRDWGEKKDFGRLTEKSVRAKGEKKK